MDDSKGEKFVAGLRSATVDKAVGHLVVINGGAAVALLAFLQAVWGKYPDLSAIVLIPILVFTCGAGPGRMHQFLPLHSSLYCEQKCQTDEKSQKEKFDELLRKHEFWTTWSWRFHWLSPAIRSGSVYYHARHGGDLV